MMSRDTEAEEKTETACQACRNEGTWGPDRASNLDLADVLTCVRVCEKLGQVRKPPPRSCVADGGGKRKEKDANFGSNDGEELRRRKRKRREERGRYELPQRAKLKNGPSLGWTRGPRLNGPGWKLSQRDSTRVRTLRHVRWHVKAQPRTRSRARYVWGGHCLVYTYTFAGVCAKGTLLATGSRPP